MVDRARGEAEDDALRTRVEVEAALRELRARNRELTRENDALRSADDVLRAERSRYRELYERSPVAYFELDVAGLVLHANREAAALLGVSHDEIVGRPLSAFMAEGDADALHRHRAGPADVGGIDVDLVRAAGTLLRVHLDLVPVPGVPDDVACLFRCVPVATPAESADSPERG